MKQVIARAGHGHASPFGLKARGGQRAGGAAPGTAAQPTGAAMRGHFPATRPLLVMVACAVVSGVLVMRLFR